MTQYSGVLLTFTWGFTVDCCIGHWMGWETFL